MDDIAKKSEQELPAFNVASLYLTRVNRLQDEIAEYSIKSKYELLFNALRALFKEISPYINADDKKVMEKKLAQIVLSYKQYKKLKEQSENLLNTYDKKIGVVLATKSRLEWKRFTSLLHEVDMTLMNHIHKTGLLMPSKKDKTLLGGIE